MNTQQKTINRLKGKIKDLQNQLCERTRNYLLKKGMKDAITTIKADQSAQTDYENLELSNFSEYLQEKSPLIDQCSTSLQKSQLRQHQPKVEVSDFFFSCNQQQLQIRRKISDLLEELKNYLIHIDENLKETQTSEPIQRLSLPQESFDRQRRKLKRQISKVTARLAFQQKISQVAKEGLLISEEQNYRFRLKILQLLKSQERDEWKIEGGSMSNPIEVELLRSEIINLQCSLEHQRQIKQQYLQNSIELQDQIAKITEENLQLKSLIVHISEFNQKQPQSEMFGKTKVIDFSQKAQCIDPEVFEQIKDTTYAISGCIPVVDQAESVFFFKPETEFEILQVLKRVQEYCKQIDKWESERIEAVSLQKKLFVQFIGLVSQQIDKNTKKILKQKLQSIEQISHFSMIFQKNDALISHQQQKQKEEYAKQIQKEAAI